MDHDRLFKELLKTFFIEFVDLFFPELAAYLDAGSIVFLEKEIFTDVTQGERHEADLVVQARFRDEPLCFLIHAEAQASAETDFPQRMFRYFARLHEEHDVPVYPIAVFSYDQPQRAEPDVYEIVFPDLEVLSFHYRVVQLNRLDWHGFVDRTNPIAAALMAKMRMSPTEPPQVKLACLRMLAQLQLDPARREVISGFVDSYLRLTMEQAEEFEAELAEIESPEKEGVMEIVTSWMEKGLEKGREEGLEKGQHQEARAIVLRLLRKRLGALDDSVTTQIDSLATTRLEELSEALLDFTSPADLTTWLREHGQ
jgi:predicted transposase YdaD